MSHRKISQKSTENQRKIAQRIAGKMRSHPAPGRSDGMTASWALLSNVPGGDSLHGGGVPASKESAPMQHSCGGAAAGLKLGKNFFCETL